MVMVVKAKARVKDRGKSTEKSNVNDIVRTITDILWSYDSVRRVVNNNYIILQAIVRNTVKSLGINADNFDLEAFNDNFDVHELDTQSQDTLADSLAKVLSKFIIERVDNDVDIAMERAPYEIESRLREVMDYLRKNPQDAETIDYAKELIKQLSEFNWSLALKYESELNTILNPKPRVTEEPKPVVRVTESKPDNEPAIDGNNVLKPVTKSRLRQIRSYESLRPKLRELRETTTRALEDAKKREIRDIEDTLRQIFELLRDPRESKYWNEYVETAKGLIEKLRKLDPERADKYERELESIINSKQSESNVVHILRTYMTYLRAIPYNHSDLWYWIEQCKVQIEKLRQLDPQLASEYERQLNTILYEKRKYANYGKREPRAKVRIRHASAKITEYFNASETENADNRREWKRYVKGILKWIMVIGLI